MADFYQIPLDDRNHPDYLKWEKLNFALRMLFDLVKNIDGRLGPIENRDEIKMDGNKISEGPIQNSIELTDFVTKSYFKSAEFGRLVVQLLQSTGKTPLPISGAEAAAGGGGAAPTDHAALTHLTYATAGHTGFVPAIRTVSTTAPLTGGGNLGSNLTLAIPKATAAVDGYLSAADFATFAAGGSSNHATLSNLSYATAGHTGFVPSARLINTTAPLTGGGDLSADRTIVIPKATAAVDGYLAAADFATFAAGGAPTPASGAYASAPAAGTSGQIYVPTDSRYFMMDNGASWDHWISGIKLTPPVLASFSWVNQGAATGVATYGGVYMTDPASAGDNLRLLTIAVPTAPYYVEIGFIPFQGIANYGLCGFCLYDSGSGKVITIHHDESMTLRRANWTNVTTWSANATIDSIVDASTQAAYPGFHLWRFRDDNTNRRMLFSGDGRTWVDSTWSESRTAHMTPTHIGIMVGSNNATWPTLAHFVHWVTG